MESKPRIGILGAGRLGTALARRFSLSGYKVTIANSKEPQSLSLILSMLLPGVHADTIPELAKQSDVIILALPSHKYAALDPKLFADKIIIDAMNYWPPTEGVIEAFSGDLSSSEVIQLYFDRSRVVKSLNHIAYYELEQDALPMGTAHRRVVILAGDDGDARKLVGELVEAIGFDAVDVGGLRNGRKFQPDTQLFDTRYTKPEAIKLLEASG
jgi:8-hydroxy-5-deazaflavin:NADPH oxidoreductase